MYKDGALTAKVEGDELVIRIGVDTLVHAAKNSDGWERYNASKHAYEPQFEIVDNYAFAKDVANELMNEQFEDGSTRLENAIDHAFEEVSSGAYDSVLFLDEEVVDDEDED